VAWALRLVPRARAEETAADLAVLRGREHGLLCNPHWQDARVAAGEIPLPWFAERPRVAAAPAVRVRAVGARDGARRKPAAAKPAAKAAGRRVRRLER
jgi:hypothetical protein